MKPLLIGQAPGPNTDPDLPLFPVPRTSAGGRLCEFMGLSKGDYMARFDRINLLYAFPGKYKRDDKFPLPKARIAADAIRPLLTGRTVVMVGRNVANAFGYPASETPWHEFVTDERGGFTYAVIPHPSGRNHWYNAEDNVAEARAFWAKVLAFHAGRRLEVVNG